MNLLHTLGLMTRAEHERLMDAYRDDWKMVCARSATDLAAQAEEIAELRKALVARTSTLDGIEADNEIKDRVIGDLNEMIDDLRPDAEAMRKKRAADRKRMAGKRNG